MEAAYKSDVIYEFGKFVLDPRERLLRCGEEAVHLRAKEFETLLLFLENNGRSISKEEMISALWPGAFVEEGNLVKQISRLRKVFKGDESVNIETLPKHGYRFSADVYFITRPLKETIIEKRLEDSHSLNCEGNLEILSPPPAGFQVYRFPAFVGAALIFVAVISVGWFWSKTSAPAQINSLAVLPLRPLTTDENSRALGLALTDTLITKIGGLRQTVVRPISAVTPFTDTQQDSIEIGKRLKVDAVLEGTIQQFDERIRLNVRLLEVKNGHQIWSEQFENDAAQIFELQDRVTAQIARALKLKLSRSENKHLTKRYTNNPGALDSYQKGRYFSGRRTASDLKTALDHFNDAIAKDPEYALAFAGLADAYSLLADYDGALPKDAYPKAKAAAMKALELDDELAEAHTSLAYVKMFYYHDWQGAEAGYQRAIELNPNYATARQWYSEYLTAVGRFDESIIEIGRAKDIDPLSPSINVQEVWVLYYSRRFDEAIERGLLIAEMNPDFAEIYDPLKRCYDQKGMYSEAIVARQRRRRLARWDATETAALKEAASAPEAAIYWRKRLEQEIEEARDELPMPFEMALIYAQLGEKDQAFQWLDKAVKERQYPIAFLRVSPDVDPLRADPRFTQLLRRVGLAS